ncbi:MAG: ABC transporter permease, partial [Terriglobales bacterium]
MAIPIAYNLRHLRQRLGATVMTAIGIALTVAIAVFILALLGGLRQAFTRSGEPLNVLVMRKGSTAEVSSTVTEQQAALLPTLPGVARNGAGRPMVSAELVVVISLPQRSGAGANNVTVRGLGAMGMALRPRVHLAAGRWFQAGQREVDVSQAVERRFAHTRIGDYLQFGQGKWRVVGVFAAGATAWGSEIWGDVHQMQGDFQRQGVYSSVLMKAADPVAADALVRRVSSDQQLELEGAHQQAYYAQQTKSGAPIEFVGWLVALIMAIGSCFAAMNTMYAAVAYREREIGTLRMLGFSRPSILSCFVLESLMLALLGWIVAVIAMWPMNGLSTGTMNSVTFSEVVFQLRLTPAVLGWALVFALIMGLIGGLAPAWQASRR